MEPELETTSTRTLAELSLGWFVTTLESQLYWIASFRLRSRVGNVVDS